MSQPVTDKEIENFKDDEIEELLSKLTAEEIEELNNDIDPDNHLLPASQRCRDQTTKQPTGKYDREKLIKFIEEKSKQEKDWDHHMPFEKKTRGKVFESKVDKSEISKKDLEEMGFDTEFDTEFDEALKNATEEELVDLAAVLGFNGMLNQLQYHASVENKEQMCGGFQGLAKYEECKHVEDEPDNKTDVGKVIEQLTANDSSLTEINLNNIRDITVDEIKRLCQGLENNTHLKKLQCTNIHIRNAAASYFVDALAKNKTLVSLNLESNFITSEVLLRILEAINHESSSLEELRMSNQQQKILGIRAEQEIANLVESNPRLRVLGLDLESSNAIIRIRDHIAANVDRNLRVNRRRQATPK